MGFVGLGLGVYGLRIDGLASLLQQPGIIPGLGGLGAGGHRTSAKLGWLSKLGSLFGYPKY